MPVDNLNIIDAVSIDKEGNAVLTISDHLVWDEANTHTLILQDKINVYLDYIENGSLREMYPALRDRKIIINLVNKHTPNAVGQEFLRRVKEMLESEGYSFTYSVL